MSMLVFDDDPIVYGHAVGSAQSCQRFLVDDIGNSYHVNAFTPAVINIKTLAVTALTNTSMTADWTSLGGTGTAPSGWTTWSIIGKYFYAIANNGSTPLTWAIILYEINTSGTVTAIGTKGYQVTFAGSKFFSSGCEATVRSDTGEIMLAYGDFSTLGINVMCIDTLANLTGAWAVRTLQDSRIMHVTETTGDYAISPAPYIQAGGSVISFVGHTMYVTLNKAIMDWHAAHTTGVGFNTYYKSICGTYPNGVQLKISISSDGAGALSYVFNGATTDYGFPFPDEGANAAGNVGTTQTTTRDCYGRATQVVEIDGTVDYVYFTRGYSDVKGQVGFRLFQGLTQILNEQEVLFSPTAYPDTIDDPRAMFSSDAIYMMYLDSAGPTYYARLGELRASEYFVTFSAFIDTGYQDWATAETTDFSSYLVTWFSYSGMDSVFMQAPWVVSFLDNTDTSPSCLMTPRWEWTNSTSNHKSGPTLEMYRIPVGTSTVSDRRTRVRGKGRALQLRWESSTAQPFNLLGWNVILDENSTY